MCKTAPTLYTQILFNSAEQARTRREGSSVVAFTSVNLCPSFYRKNFPGKPRTVCPVRTLIITTQNKYGSDDN